MCVSQAHAVSRRVCTVRGSRLSSFSAPSHARSLLRSPCALFTPWFTRVSRAESAAQLAQCASEVQPHHITCPRNRSIPAPKPKVTEASRVRVRRPHVNRPLPMYLPKPIYRISLSHHGHERIELCLSRSRLICAPFLLRPAQLFCSVGT